MFSFRVLELEHRSWKPEPTNPDTNNAMDSPNTPFLSITDDDDVNLETNDKIYEDSPLNCPNPKHRRHVLVTIFHLTTYLLALWGLIAIPLLTHSSILSPLHHPPPPHPPLKNTPTLSNFPTQSITTQTTAITIITTSGLK